MYQRNLQFHFTGIGGSGMSGIAEILLGLGFSVSGSDLKASSVTERLSGLGAIISIGHSGDAVPASCTSLVYSSAVDASNPELIEARRRGIPVIRRAEVLAELMRLKYGVAVAGSHGKTTTTSMTAAILEEGGLDPTVVIGGQVKSIGSGSRLGRGDYLVAESDESDRSFLLLKPTVAVVTNIDAEHMGTYGTLAELERSFREFVNAVPFYGLAVLCLDDPRVRELAAEYRGRKITYGFSPEAQIRASQIRLHGPTSSFVLTLPSGEELAVTLAMPGRHMVQNSLAAIAVGIEFGIEISTILSALEKFSGVERRLEIIGESHGITVMNDYGHHPVEIRATLRAVREGWGDRIERVVAIFQPHRYSRTKDCFAEFVGAFVDCDRLLCTEIYSAGEAAIEGVSGAVLADAIAHENKAFHSTLDSVADTLVDELRAGDLVVCLGAGSVGALPERILGMLGNRPRLAAVG